MLSRFVALFVSLTGRVSPLQTQVANSQQGTAFVELSHDPGADFKMVVRYEMYCGDGTGADGLCVNIGGNDLGGRVGENGVTQGVAVCFDEWANGGDHGVAIYYNAGTQGDGDTSRAGAIWEVRNDIQRVPALRH